MPHYGVVILVWCGHWIWGQCAGGVRSNLVDVVTGFDVLVGSSVPS